MIPNAEFRAEIMRRGFKEYQVAEKMGISRQRLSIILGRAVILQEQKDRIMKALDELEKEEKEKDKKEEGEKADE